MRDVLASLQRYDQSKVAVCIDSFGIWGRSRCFSSVSSGSISVTAYLLFSRI